MNVIANVNMNKPTVIVFDPRDEIVHFPASLFMGLTNQLCPQDSFVVEEHIHSQYKTFLVAVKDILMEEGMTFTQFVRKFMTRRSDPSACHDTSPNLFVSDDINGLLVDTILMPSIGDRRHTTCGCCE